MTINTYTKRWCDEQYDLDREEFYVKNAYYILNKNWATSGLAHGIISLLFALALYPIIGLFNSLEVIAIMTLAYYVVAIRKYNANHLDSNLGIYISIVIFLFLTKLRTPMFVQVIFLIPSFALFVYLSIVTPIKVRALEKEMKQMIEEEEKEDDKKAKQAYANWEAQFKGTLPPIDDCEEEPPKLKQARELFKGYEDKSMLKARYRVLAKNYHPDMGGDEELFAYISHVYNELKEK